MVQSQAGLPIPPVSIVPGQRRCHEASTLYGVIDSIPCRAIQLWYRLYTLPGLLSTLLEEGIRSVFAADDALTSRTTEESVVGDVGFIIHGLSRLAGLPPALKLLMLVHNVVKRGHV